MKARIVVVKVVAAVLVWGAGNAAWAALPTDVSRSTGGPPGLLSPPRAPVITAIEQPVTYRQQFTISSPEAGHIVRVAIHTARHAATRLEIASRAPGSLVAVAPWSPEVAVPGDYLLTIAERRHSGLIPSAPVAFVLQPAPPDGSSTLHGKPSSVGGSSRSGRTADLASAPGSARAAGTTGARSGGGSPSGDVRTGAQPLSAPVGHRSPLGSPPWMPLGLVLAFLATAAGLKRLS